MRLKIDEGIFDVDLSPWDSYIAWSPGRDYFNLRAGVSPYHLLHYLTQQLPPGNHLVSDCGTLYGCSALALASGNPEIEVHTWDVHDHIGDKRKLTVDDLLRKANGTPRIHRHIGRGCLDGVNILAEWSIEKSIIIYLDIDPHDGKQEIEFVLKLGECGFKGLLVCDDINLNPRMREFWMLQLRGVGVRQIDLCKVGHHAGTGAVVFDPTVVDLEISI